MRCEVLREFYFAFDGKNATRLTPGGPPVEIPGQHVPKLEAEGLVRRLDAVLLEDVRLKDSEIYQPRRARKAKA